MDTIPGCSATENRHCRSLVIQSWRTERLLLPPTCLAVGVPFALPDGSFALESFESRPAGLVGRGIR